MHLDFEIKDTNYHFVDNDYDNLITVCNGAELTTYSAVLCSWLNFKMIISNGLQEPSLNLAVELCRKILPLNG